LWLIFLCLFVALFSEPSIVVKQFNADAAIAVDIVNPGTIYFGV
jgi:hypothetical protein